MTNSLLLASTPEDAAAAEAVRTHHAQLAGALAVRVAAVLAEAENPGTDPAAADRARRALVDQARADLLPHARAEEAVLYPLAAQETPARLLIEGMLAEHRTLTELVDLVASATTPARAAAFAVALQVLFREHLDKENDLVIPLLAARPDRSLAGALAGMHELLGESAAGHGAAAGSADGTAAVEGATSGCGGGCGCGGAGAEAADPVVDVRELPHDVRHAMVLAALDTVDEGRSLVLVAPHDPVPLLRQLQQRRPDVFAVEYLESGPETWRRRLTRAA